MLSGCTCNFQRLYMPALYLLKQLANFVESFGENSEKTSGRFLKKLLQFCETVLRQFSSIKFLCTYVQKCYYLSFFKKINKWRPRGLLIFIFFLCWPLIIINVNFNLYFLTINLLLLHHHHHQVVINGIRNLILDFVVLSSTDVGQNNLAMKCLLHQLEIWLFPFPNLVFL